MTKAGPWFAARRLSGAFLVRPTGNNQRHSFTPLTNHGAATQQPVTKYVTCEVAIIIMMT